MLRVNYCLKRSPKLSEEQFRDFFRKTYGPLVAKHQTTLDIRRYVQSYTMIPDKYGVALRQGRPEMHAPFDGTATFWWHNRDRLDSLLKVDEGKAAMEELLECEREFVDLSHSCIFLSKEVPQINPMPENGILALPGSSIIKVIYVLRARPELGREGCQQWWQMRHGWITRRHGVALGFLRYIQSHTIEDPLNDTFRTQRGTVDLYDGLTEVWFNHMELDNLINTPDCEGAQVFGLLLEDEYKFVDMGRSSTWFAKEHVLVDSGLEPWTDID